MSRWARWLVGVMVVILSAAAAAGIAIARFDPNDYKPAIVAAVQDATGRTLALNGPIQLARSLWPTLEVSDVTLSNLPGGSRPDMARAERVAAKLSLLPLLWHRIEVSELTLVGPNILFEQVNGQPNWRFDPPDRADAAPVVASGTPFQLRIRNAQVQNGMVTWRLPARTKVLGIRSLAVQHHADTGPLDLDAVLVYSDNQPFGLVVSATPTGRLSDPWTTMLDFRAFGTTASATGTMDVAGQYDFQIQATSPALDRLNALLPDMRLPALHNATMSTRIGNGKQPGDLPVIGATRLRFTDADLGNRVPGLTLGAFDVVLDKPGGTAAITGAGRYANQPFTLAGSVGAPMYPDGRFDMPIDLTAKNPAGSLGLKGTMRLRTLVFDGLDAAGSVSVPALAAFRTSVLPSLPALTDLHVAGHVVIPATFGSVAFNAAKFSASGSDLAGEGAVLVTSPMNVMATLQGNHLDLDAMLKAFDIDLSVPQSAAADARWVIPDTPLPWAVLRGPTIDLAVAADTAVLQGQSWRAVQLGLQLQGGHLRKGTLAAGSSGGPVALSMTADAANTAVPVTLDLEAPGVPLALVAQHAGLRGPVSGSARIAAKLRGAGSSLHGLAASLDGTASVSAVGGQMSNAEFIAFAGPSLAALGIAVPSQGETVLRCLGVAVSFANGVGRVSPIALETTYLTLEGRGEVDLRQETLNLQLKPLVPVSGSPVAVPVVVQGPFRAITGRLDADGFDKIGLMLDGLFGGDRMTACSDAGLSATPK